MKTLPSPLPESPETDRFLSRRWILVAGTGLESGVPQADVLAARAVARELVTHRYGLITGGWPGVDYVVTEEFLRQLHNLRLHPRDYLIQVVPGDRAVFHDEGQVVRTSYGPQEWQEPQKYADAVV